MPLFPNNVTSKLPHVETSIFAVMSAMANKYKAINLSQGFPDFDISPKLIELVNHYMHKGYNQYAPMPGIFPLRETIAAKVEELYGANYHPDREITISAGATEAIFSAITAIIKKGDEVIIFEPAYDSYAPSVELCGGVPVYAQLKTPDYHIDWNEVDMMVTPKTKMIIINSPHNPTGAILSGADMRELIKLTKNTNIVILSDEVYEHLVFDGKVHESCSRYPELAERSMVIGSFGKTFHVTGWKTGYCLAPENLMAEFRKVHQFVVFACNTPAQYAITDMLKDKENFNYLNSFFQGKRDYFADMIKESRFNAIPSYGTYFQLLDYSRISDEKEMDFATRLIKEYGVASIPVSAFYHKNTDNKVLRFCFAKKEETLKKAAEILCKI